MSLAKLYRNELQNTESLKLNKIKPLLHDRDPYYSKL